MGLIQKIFGTYSQRELKSIYPIADKIEALEEEYRALTDEQLQAKTPEFKQRLQQGETLDDILPEAFAAVREAADRVLGLRPYRVQLIGGIVLHQGRIAEMKTGEGKTLVATLPAYLNALTGNGVHIVTVNDYLAKRDSEWMGKVHRFMGLTVGLIVHDLTKEQRQAAYAASKHAMAGFTKTLAAEVYEQGIRVHLISPGGVFTDMAKVSRPDLTGEEMITAEDIAEIAAFLVLRRTNAVIDEIEVHRANKAPFA